MSQPGSQLDGSNEEYVTLANQTYDSLTTVPIPVIGIPAGTMTKYKGLLDTVNSSWAIVKHKTTSTSTQLTTFEISREALTKFLRTFVKQWLYDNDAATDDIIKATGFRVHSTTRTHHDGQPAETPVCGVKPISGHGLQFSVRTEEGNSGKPNAVSVVRIRYFIGEDAPADPSEFAHFQDFTKRPYLLMLNASDAGKTITIGICYVSSTGAIEGNYCVVIITKIP